MSGDVYAFGRNNYGQLGLGQTGDSLLPQRIISLQNVTVCKVAAGFYHSAVIVKESNVEEPTKTCHALNKDLVTLVNNPLCSDIYFLLNNDRLYAHRCIINARSETLRQMINSPMKEGTQKEVVIREHSVSCSKSHCSCIT